MKSTEKQLKNRLIHLSCVKLVAVKQTESPLRRSLHLLTVIKQAHEEGARFAPECSHLMTLPPPKRVSFAQTVTIHPIPNRHMVKAMSLYQNPQPRREKVYPCWLPSGEFNPRYVMVSEHTMRKRKLSMHTDLVQKRHACVA